jgi:hypothetical protein
MTKRLNDSLPAWCFLSDFWLLLGSPVRFWITLLALTAIAPLVTAAYGGETIQASIAYDGSPALAFCYDSIEFPLFAEVEGRSIAPSGASGQSDDFLAADSGAVQVFRAVDQNELPSVLNGTYGSSLSASGKYFALTQEGAQNIANSTMSAGQQMTITSTTVPQSVFNQGYLFNDAGGAGASIHFRQEFLPKLYNSMTPIKIH